MDCIISIFSINYTLIEHFNSNTQNNLKESCWIDCKSYGSTGANKAKPLWTEAPAKLMYL